MNRAATVETAPAMDMLTGLYSTAGLVARLDAWGRDALPRPVQAMLLGFHRFQSVNLAYGEAAGDRALAEIARRIESFCASEIEDETLVARVGGRDFLVASRSSVSRERWQWLADALAVWVSGPMSVGGETLQLRPRIALLRATSGESADTLLDRLDQALTLLQQQAGRRLIWADGSHVARARSAARLEADVIGALDRDEIGIVFQPQFAVADGHLTGAEALARWDHPELGRIGAGTLFAVAGRADHVAQLSRHIARRALTEAARWPGALRLSLNVTAEDLAEPGFADGLRAELADSGFPPWRLTLEITEQALIHDLEGSARLLRGLTDEGVAIALDDFGTGFSNFRTLKALPVSCLKLDRSLVRDLTHDERDRAILRAIVAMARALGLSLVAEGVEDDGQLAVLREEGCTTYQGFLGSPPVSGARLLDL